MFKQVTKTMLAKPLKKKKAKNKKKYTSRSMLEKCGHNEISENLNTYIVSHGWTHPLLSKIEVIKENEISRLDG